ncbi:heme exporter protein CcmD [Teredinibacter waterburyi]|jgi:heme exporter protein CcmD|uniref:heme exporter protein CcmD n=1 Tax=Teredinibacter waterburyi TaxID=1500538 RepID=UPI00165EC6A3|nr:heme exporter protein CcmD [Teredinibacter waterburyi]
MDIVFQFDNLAAFFAMKGHGGYVFACYGATLLGLAYLAISPALAKRKFMKTQRAIQARAELRS